jgi:hypothetical protein
MEIHNNGVKISSLKTIRNRLGAKRIIAILLIVIALGGFGFGCIIYGAYLNQTAQTSVLKMFLIRISEFDFTFLAKYTKSKTTDIDLFDIDIKFKNWEKIRYLRKMALADGINSDGIEQEVPAKIRFNDHTYKVDISLTGMTGEHVRHPEKWSLAIKVKDGKTIMGMKKFAILVTQSRGYLTDWIATKLIQSQGGVGLRSDFVNININGKNHGVYYLEERFDKRLIENNKNREGVIFRADDYGSDIKVYGLKTIQKNAELSSQLVRLKQMWHLFMNGELEANKILDLKKFATIFAVSDLMNQKHALFFMNMRLYFNPVTSLIEPIGREWGYLRKSTYTHPSLSIGKPVTHGQAAIQENAILSMIVNSPIFEEEYIRQLNLFTSRSYLDSIVETNKEELDALLSKIHLQNPFYNFPIDLLYKNQEFLHQKLFPHIPLIKVSFNSLAGDSIVLNIENKIDLPIEIYSFIYNNKVILPDSPILLRSNFKSEEPFQELTVLLDSNINKNFFSVDSLEVTYGILGLGHIKSTIVFQSELTQYELMKINPTQQLSNVDQFNFIKIDERDKTIKFSKNLCTIDRDLVIPKGFVVIAEPGCKINLINSSRIISYSPFKFSGQEDNLITITSIDSTGQGIVVYNCDQKSELSYIYFCHLSNIFDNGWDLRGAITFYNSSVNINQCLFSSNLRGDDYLNIIKTDFSISNTTFENTNADAFDSDFSSGLIKNVKFLQVGNDAIDVSGTKLNVIDVEIINAADKGISAGEGSLLNCENIIIEGGEIAVASKDNTTIEIDNIIINSSKLAYCAFQKKSEYGAGVIVANNSKVTNADLEYLIEIGSSLSVNGRIIEDKSDKVKEMLYGAEYGKSSGK